MNQPLVTRNKAYGLEPLLDQTRAIDIDDLDELARKMGTKRGGHFVPQDDIAEALFLMWNAGGVTKAAVDWLLSLTLTCPHPSVPDTFEAAAILRAARHESRQGVGETIYAALIQGEAVHKRKTERADP